MNVLCVYVTVTGVYEWNVEKSVVGLATLNNRLYVGYFRSTEIEVFDMKENKFNKLSSIQIPYLEDATDMTSCHGNQCIYVADLKKAIVIRVENENNIAGWSVNDKPHGLSVNSLHNVLVTCSYERTGKIKEFTTAGQLLREIKLQSDIVLPWHAIQLSTDQFVVCYNHRVSIVNDAGIVLHSYGGNPGSGSEQLNRPERLAARRGFIYVSDFWNNRIMLFNSKLFFIREILSNLSYQPNRMCFGEASGGIIAGSGTMHVYSS